MSQTSRPRLPTRCPVCKGAVIERMPGSPHGTFISFYCLFCNHAWRFALDDAYAGLNGDLAGTISVVTTTGEQRNLGSVEVHALAEDALNKHLKSKALQNDRESRKLQSDIDALATKLAKAQVEEERLWKIQKRDERDLKKANAWSVAYNRTKDIARQLKDLHLQRRHLGSGEYFFQGLPSPIATGKTDADGKFTLVIPRQGRYGIVATAVSDADGEREAYFWFVWVSLDGLASKRLRLTNDNMMGAGSPDSALQ
jgi:hypothetical protein